MQGTGEGETRGHGQMDGMRREKIGIQKIERERKFLLNIHHQGIIKSSAAPGHNNKLCAVTMVTGQAAVNTTAEAVVCPLRLELPNTTILILTYADGDVCWPLVVVLAGDRSFPNQLKAKLTLKPQDSSIWEVLPFPNAVEGSPRVSTALFVYFWRETVRKFEMNDFWVSVIKSTKNICKLSTKSLCEMFI